MSDRTLEERLAAVERAVTGGEYEPEGDAPAAAESCDELEERLSALESRLTDLEAAVQAVRGYVGNVRQVDEELERRADAALAKAEAVEERVAALEDRSGGREPDPWADGRGCGFGPAGRPDPDEVGPENGDGDSDDGDGNLLARLRGSL